MKKGYETFSEAINDLLDRGYSTNFSLHESQSKFERHEHSARLPPHGFIVDEVHHFEGNDESEDEMIVFAISSRKYGVKGIVFNAFANYNEREHLLELMLRLRLK